MIFVRGTADTPAIVPEKLRRTAAGILAAVCVSHTVNDILQSLIPAVYPILKTTYRLDFSQIGLITLVGQSIASLLQPLVGLFTDRRSEERRVGKESRSRV